METPTPAAPQTRRLSFPVTLDPSAILIVALGIYTAIFLLWLVIRWGHPGLRTVISDLAFIPSGFAAAVLAWQTSRHPHLNQRTRRAWTVLTAAFFVFWAGDVLWSYLEVVRGGSPFPSLADIEYLLFYPLMLVGLLAFPVAPQTRADKSKFWLDALTVLLGGWMVVWYFVLGPTAVAADSSALLTILSAGYPVGDLVLIFGVTALFLHTPEERSRVALGILAGGITAFLIADLSFGFLSLRDAYKGGDWPDGFWMIAQFLFGMSAYYQRWRASPEVSAEHPPAPEVRPVSTLPYAAVAIGYLMLVVAGRGAPVYPLGGLLFGAIAVTAVVLVRQLSQMNENIRLLSDLRALARTDDLTGLLTRRHFFELAGREFARAARYQRPLAAIMIDLDNLKPVNDRFGHEAGDEVLRIVAARLMQDMREIDLLGRYGGDEVVALLPETTEEGAVVAAGHLLRDVAAAPLVTGAESVTITLSAGVAEADGCPDLATLLRRADVALYRAKAAGRNCVRGFSA